MAGFVTVVAILLLLANLPFFTVRFMGLVDVGRPKPGRWLLVEVFSCYVLALLGVLFVEHQLEGVSYTQGWAFYSILSCLFVVAGFPGFVRFFFWKASSCG